MIIRNLGDGKGYSIVFCTKNGKDLAKTMIGELKFWNNGVDKNKAIFLENKNGSKMYFHKNVTHYIVEYIAKNKESCETMIYIVEDKLKLVDNELRHLSLEQMTSDNKIHSDNWIHSDLFGNSMLNIAEIIYPLAEREVNKVKKNYHYLRNFETHDIIMKLFEKWEDNQNYFSGNNKMLYTLIQISVVNLMNTLHNKEKEKCEKTISIEDKYNENTTYGDTLKDENDSLKEIISKIMLSTLSSIEKDIVTMLYSGYKTTEICNKLHISELELSGIVKRIADSRVLYI